MSDTINEEEVVQEVEEFDQDIFDSMVHGTFEVSEDENSVEEDVVDTAEDFDEEDNEDQEDTDQEEESNEDEELDEADDGELDEDSDTEEDDEEEDALVEDYDSDDEDGDADEAPDEESEDETETEETSDGESQDTDEVDYKAFYDAVVNTEFVVNGRKTKGFADPKKIIQSQQMAGGFSEKMAGFKQYRPFMAPLKERGMLEDQAKFDLAMNLIDGDKEAIKAHLQSLSIDPLDLDMDEIKYSATPTRASEESLIIEDVMERARATGIEDRVRQVVGKEWDVESFQEFTSNEAVRNDLLTHIETGAYDLVQDKMLEMSRLDFDGRYGGMSTINKYRAAVAELQKEQPVAREAPAPKTTTAPAKTSVKAEKAKIEQARKERAYKEKAAKEASKLNQKRSRAASMSKKSAKPKPKPQFDPMKVEGSELDELMDFLATGGRA